MKSRTDKALDYMLAAIARGAEFPDIAFKAAEKFKLNQKRLEAAYDLMNSDHAGLLLKAANDAADRELVRNYLSGLVRLTSKAKL